MNQIGEVNIVTGNVLNKTLTIRKGTDATAEEGIKDLDEVSGSYGGDMEGDNQHQPMQESPNSASMTLGQNTSTSQIQDSAPPANLHGCSYQNDFEALTWQKLIMLRWSDESSLNEAREVLKPYIANNLCNPEKMMLRRTLLCWRGHFKKKWAASRRQMDRFMETEKDWLSREVPIPKSIQRQKAMATSQTKPSCNADPQNLLLGTARTIGKIGTPGSKARSQLLRKIAGKKSRAAKFLKSYKEKKHKQRNLTSEEGLKVLLELSLTKEQYNTLRRVTNEAGHKNLFPSYKRVGAAKLACRPLASSITGNQKSVEVKLESILNHTCKRVVQLQEELHKLEFEKSGQQVKEMKMIFSWGMDGAGSQSYYNQRGLDDNFMDESHLFIVSVVPLQLCSSDTLYWRNPKPQSPYSCRPIKMIYQKEERDFAIKERELIETQISKLAPCHITIDNKYTLIVSFELHLTLLDGKLLSFFTNTNSQQSCPICHANPTDFNPSNIGTEKFAPKDLSLTHGISPLHAWIRLFECCLHISYPLPFKVWRVPKQLQQAVKVRKRKIQVEMWKKFGLRVDFPNASGGNSNNGNTARRAFEDVNLFATVLGLDEQFIRNLKRILVCLTCQLAIDTVKFGDLCHETALMYHKLYGSWFYMPSTLHKILVHGREIMESSPLPLGVVGEDGQESRHKFYRLFRQNHSRKRNRTLGNLDVFKRSLDTSDPFLWNDRLTIRRPTKRKSIKIIEDLLLAEQPYIQIPKEKNCRVDAEFDFDDTFFEYFDTDVPVEEEIEI